MKTWFARICFTKVRCLFHFTSTSVATNCTVFRFSEKTVQKMWLFIRSFGLVFAAKLGCCNFDQCKPCTLWPAPGFAPAVYGFLPLSSSVCDNNFVAQNSFYLYVCFEGAHYPNVVLALLVSWSHCVALYYSVRTVASPFHY